MGLGKTLKSYLWWTHARGSVHYDVMVTLILAFIFLAPLKIDFHDRPVSRTVQRAEVAVSSDGANGFVYRVPATAVAGSTDQEISDSLQRIIEPITGAVEITKIEKVRDKNGRVNEYRAWAERR